MKCFIAFSYIRTEGEESFSSQGSIIFNEVPMTTERLRDIENAVMTGLKKVHPASRFDMLTITSIAPIATPTKADMKVGLILPGRR